MSKLDPLSWFLVILIFVVPLILIGGQVFGGLLS